MADTNKRRANNSRRLLVRKPTQGTGDDMRQLTSLDAQYLMEDGRMHMHVLGLAVLDTSTSPAGELTRADLLQLVSERLHLLPPFRWRLVAVPLNLDHPYWIEDDDLDLEYHIREVALPRPGDDQQLATLAAEIASRPLDRSRPLWELHLVRGLASGHTALITKLHHAAIDGISGTELFSVLLDASPDGREVRPRTDDDRGEREPTQFAMLARGLVGMVRQPARALQVLPHVLPNLDAVPTLRTIPGVESLSTGVRRASRLGVGAPDGGFLEVPRLRAPRTRLNGPITPHRHMAFASLSLDDVKTVKRHFGVTVNDVVVAMCAGALRTWLISRDELPEDPLVAVVPLSVRAGDETGVYGNQIILMTTSLPTDEPDPALRLASVHEELRVAKERYRAIPATLLQDVNEFIPPALLARAGRAMLALGASARTAPAWNVMISNVPGSPSPLYCGGSRMLAHYPTSAITHGAGLNMTVISYLGHQLDIGVIGDRDQVGDAWPLVAAVGEELAGLLELVPADAS